VSPPSAGADLRAIIIDYVRAKAAARRLRGKRCEWRTMGEISEPCSAGSLDYDEWCQPCRDRHDHAEEHAAARRTVRRLWAMMRRIAERTP
jgi:hypothetical protein